MAFRDVPHAAASFGALLALARVLTLLVFIQETGRAAVTGDVVARTRWARIRLTFPSGSEQATPGAAGK
jgi:hypothetical protein